MADFDSPWKEALSIYFQAFLAFFFPGIHDDIDWSRGYELLNKELQKIAPKGARGRRYVDLLVKVWRKNGKESWVLIHVEVQTSRDPTLMARLYGYNTRIADRYNRQVVTLAVLADDKPGWCPNTYEDSLWGWSVRMTFPVVKVLDYAGREAELEASRNPFARVVLAHLKALETRRDPQTRLSWKIRLIRGLLASGFRAEDVRQLFRLIEWLMDLPSTLEKGFRREVDQYEEGRSMPYVTGIERLGMLRVLEHLLNSKFGEKGANLMPAIEELNDAEKYLALSRAILTTSTLDEVRQAIAQVSRPRSRRRTKRIRSKGEPG